jgi:hypothetical protein
MRKALVSSCGIAAAALGAAALSAEPLKIVGGKAIDLFGDRSAVQGESDAVRLAQAAPPPSEPGKRRADDPNGQAPPAGPNGQVPPAGPSGQAAADDPEDSDGPGDDADDRRGEPDDDRDGVDDAN